MSELMKFTFQVSVGGVGRPDEYIEAEDGEKAAVLIGKVLTIKYPWGFTWHREHPTPQLIVCEDDRVLCGSCHAEQLDERDQRTWAALTIEKGECQSCGKIRL